MISFKVPARAMDTIDAIVERAATLAHKYDTSVNRFELTMDITATHANGCPLKLDELIQARDSDFVHDVFGIRRHIDRRTGQLGDCFLPRFADLNAPQR